MAMIGKKQHGWIRIARLARNLLGLMIHLQLSSGTTADPELKGRLRPSLKTLLLSLFIIGLKMNKTS
jgi:hypothetical protein